MMLAVNRAALRQIREDRTFTVRYDFQQADWIARGADPDVPAGALNYPIDAKGFLLPRGRDYCLDIEVVNLHRQPRWRRLRAVLRHVRRFRAEALSLRAAVRLAWVCVWA